MKWIMGYPAEETLACCFLESSLSSIFVRSLTIFVSDDFLLVCRSDGEHST